MKLELYTCYSLSSEKRGKEFFIIYDHKMLEEFEHYDDFSTFYSGQGNGIIWINNFNNKSVNKIRFDTGILKTSEERIAKL